MDFYENLAEQMMAVHGRGPFFQKRITDTMQGEMAVLRFLNDTQGTLSAGELGRRTGFSTSRMAAILNNLEKKQMIRRNADEKDKRKVLVLLTDSGKAFCDGCLRHLKGDLVRMLEGLGENDAAQFVRIIKRLHDEHLEPCPPEEDAGIHSNHREVRKIG